MVPKLLATIIWISLVVGAVPADAAGVIHNLPEDRAWVRFGGEMGSLTEGQPSAPILITISSVGQATVLGEAYRWIEMRIEFFQEDGSKQPPYIMKGLFPAEQLKLGGDPMNGLLRAWGKTGDTAPMEVSDADRAEKFQMHERFLGLLGGPLEDVERLDKHVVDSALGKLECEGLVGHVRSAPHDGLDSHMIYELRLHKDAPFGVVAVKIKLELKSGEKVLAKGTFIDLKLTALGTDAKSELPGHE
jgi:hypothetical protein